jgi:hypothetical protein
VPLFFWPVLFEAFWICRYTDDIEHGFISWVIHSLLLSWRHRSGMSEAVSMRITANRTPSPSCSIARKIILEDTGGAHTRRRAALHGDDCAVVGRETEASYPPALTAWFSRPLLLKAPASFALIAAWQGTGRKRATMPTTNSSASTGRRRMTSRSLRASRLDRTPSRSTDCGFL